MKRKIEQDRISGWKGGMAAQWAVFQAYAFGTPLGRVRVALWQRDIAQGEHFTECLDSLLKDIEKKDKPSLT